MALSQEHKEAIYILSKVGFRQVYLAKKFNVTPAYISTLIKKMEEAEEFYKKVDLMVENVRVSIEEKAMQIEKDLKGDK